MFSLVCVYLSMVGSHVTIPHDPLDLTVQPLQTWDITGQDPPSFPSNMAWDLTGQGPPPVLTSGAY